MEDDDGLQLNIYSAAVAGASPSKNSRAAYEERRTQRRTSMKEKVKTGMGRGQLFGRQTTDKGPAKAAPRVLAGQPIPGLTLDSYFDGSAPSVEAAAPHAAAPRKTVARSADKPATDKPAKRKRQVEPDEDGDQDENEERPRKKRKRVDTSEAPGESVEDAAPEPARKGERVSALFTLQEKLALERAEIKPQAAVNVKVEVFEGSPFSALGLDVAFVEHLKECGFEKMTHIQALALPHLMAGKDVLMEAETGSGKTLAYAVPVIAALLARSERITRDQGCFAMFMAPTRELCIQIEEVLTKVSKPYHWLVPGSVMGGQKKKSEKARLRKGVTMLVATPGRLLDHLENTAALQCPNLQFLVLDEADRLLDLGFEQPLKQIVAKLAERAAPASRQSILCSATLRPDVLRLANLSLREPIRISVKGAKGKKVEATKPKPSEEKKEVATEAADAKRPKKEKAPPAATKDEERALATAAVEKRAKKKAGDESSESEEEKEARPKTSALLVGTGASKKFASDDEDEDDEGGSEGGSDEAEAEEEEEEEEEEETLKDASSKAKAKAEVVTEDARRRSGKDELSVPEQLRQFYVVTPPKQRLVTLFTFLRWKTKAKNHKSIVFVSTCESVDFHHHVFTKADMREDPTEEGSEPEPPLAVPVMRLHGKMDQGSRTKVYQQFRKATSGVLFCTDVAARGLDLPDVEWIVQYDAPNEAAEYVHRIGRTARLGTQGNSLIFLMPSEEGYLEFLKQRKIAPEEMQQAKILRQLLDGPRRRGLEAAAVAVQQSFEALVSGTEDAGSLAQRAFMSFVRAYGTHGRDQKHIFHVKRLHMGHLAKAFALRKTPSAVARIDASAKKGPKEPEKKQRKRKNGPDEILRQQREMRRKLAGSGDNVQRRALTVMAGMPLFKAS